MGRLYFSGADQLLIDGVEVVAFTDAAKQQLGPRWAEQITKVAESHGETAAAQFCQRISWAGIGTCDSMAAILWPGSPDKDISRIMSDAAFSAAQQRPALVLVIESPDQVAQVAQCAAMMQRWPGVGVFFVSEMLVRAYLLKWAASTVR